jgi:ribonuclease HI
MAKITIYTDGSARNSTHNHGGYGIVLINGVVKQFAGGQYSNTSSGRMELMAVVQGLKKCKIGDEVEVWSDNRYVVNTLAEGWLFRWIDENFSGRKNKDLLKQLHEQYLRLDKRVTLNWNKGHSGIHFNEVADRLATIGSKREKIIVDREKPFKPCN